MESKYISASRSVVGEMWPRRGRVNGFVAESLAEEEVFCGLFWEDEPVCCLREVWGGEGVGVGSRPSDIQDSLSSGL